MVKTGRLRIAGSSRRHERGASMLELVIASTIFSIVMMSALASSSSFSATMNDQFTIQDQFTAANVTRMRILGDADSSSSVSCPQADRLMLILGGAPPTIVGYGSSAGKLWRYSNPPDHASILVDRVQSLTCTDLGTDGIYVSIDLGTVDLPYHMHLRISAGGGGA